MSNYYPPVGFYFGLSFTGASSANDASFQEVSGITAELGVVEVKEGGENRFAHRLPDRAKYSNLVLKRGLMLASSGVGAWCMDTIAGSASTFETRDVTVSLYDAGGNPLMTWNFVAAWPVKWSISDLDAQANKVVVESLELAYTYFTTGKVKELGPTGFFTPP